MIGNRVYRQVRGIAIGGTCSAQLASMYCIMREHTFYSRPWHKVEAEIARTIDPVVLPKFPFRFCDNIVGIVSEGVPATSILKHFEKLYDLKLQIEGEGQHLTTLEAVVHLDEKGRVQMGYKRLGEQFSGDPTRALVRYVDKHSPNA